MQLHFHLAAIGQALKVKLVIVGFKQVKSLKIRPKRSVRRFPFLLALPNRVIDDSDIVLFTELLFSNYSPKWRWLVVDICLYCKHCYPPLANKTEVNSCLVYTKKVR